MWDLANSAAEVQGAMLSTVFAMFLCEWAGACGGVGMYMLELTRSAAEVRRVIASVAVVRPYDR